MTKAELKKIKHQQWNELYDYVRDDILGYGNKALPRYFVLRLKGLSEGKFMANKKTKPLASYSYSDILLTFKVCSLNIKTSIHDKSKFNDERHMVNYIMVIVENKINDVVTMRKKKEQAEREAKKLELTTHLPKAEYNKRTEENNNPVLQDLW